MYYIKRQKQRSGEDGVVNYNNLKFWSYTRRRIANTENKYYLISNGSRGYLRDRFFTEEEDGSFNLYASYKRKEEAIDRKTYDRIMDHYKNTGYPKGDGVATRNGSLYVSKRVMQKFGVVRPDNTLELCVNHNWYGFQNNTLNYLLPMNVVAQHSARRGGNIIKHSHTQVPIIDGMTLDASTFLPSEEYKSKYELVVYKRSRKKLAELRKKYEPMLMMAKTMFANMSTESLIELVKPHKGRIVTLGWRMHSSDTAKASLALVDELVDSGNDLDAFAVWLARTNGVLWRRISGYFNSNDLDVHSLIHKSVERFNKTLPDWQIAKISDEVVKEVGDPYGDTHAVIIRLKEKQHV